MIYVIRCYIATCSKLVLVILYVPLPATVVHIMAGPRYKQQPEKLFFFFLTFCRMY